MQKGPLTHVEERCYTSRALVSASGPGEPPSDGAGRSSWGAAAGSSASRMHWSTPWSDAHMTSACHNIGYSVGIKWQGKVNLLWRLWKPIFSNVSDYFLVISYDFVTFVLSVLFSLIWSGRYSAGKRWCHAFLSNNQNFSNIWTNDSRVFFSLRCRTWWTILAEFWVFALNNTQKHFFLFSFSFLVAYLVRNISCYGEIFKPAISSLK